MEQKQDKKLFTPGPLLTSRTVKEASLRDLGSRDLEFIEAVKSIRSELLKVAGVDEAEWTTVPLQGSGTFAVEAVIQTATPREHGKVLILANGAYGKRMMKICETAGIEFDFTLTSEDKPVPADLVTEKLKQSQFNLVTIVHCETSSGVLNRPEEIAKLVRDLQPQAAVFVDAMSSFGAIPINLENIDFLVSSANKCLEGIPGFSYAICRKSKLSQCKGNCRSLSLDLFDQVEILDQTSQFRFTPPTHVILAFRRALEEFWDQGGVAGRGKRYEENRSILKSEMKKLGFKELVPDEFSTYIITTYLLPNDSNFCFKSFYSKLSEKDQVIYPGKVTDADTFRIGNIGHLFPDDIHHLIQCIVQVLEEMGVNTPVSY